MTNTDIEAVKNLVSSGFWFSINRLSMVFLDGLDLLIANLYLGPNIMAVIALAKTAPGFINTFTTTMVQTFSPNITILYAQKKNNELLQDILFYMKFIGWLVATPIAGFIAVGDIFYQLWIPSQDSKLLHSLSILIISCILITGITSVLKNVFLTMNRFKLPSLVLLISGLASTSTVLILINISNLGIWAVVGVSVIITFIRELVFTPFYTARLLQIHWKTFYGIIARTIFVMIVNTSLFIIIKDVLLLQNSWSALILFSLIMGILGYIISLGLLLNKTEKKELIETIKKKWSPANQSQ